MAGQWRAHHAIQSIPQQIVKKHGDESDDEIHHRPCKCRPDDTGLGILVISRIDMHRFCPSEARHQQGDGADRIQMTQRIQ